MHSIQQHGHACNEGANGTEERRSSNKTSLPRTQSRRLAGAIVTAAAPKLMCARREARQREQHGPRRLLRALLRALQHRPKP